MNQRTTAYWLSILLVFSAFGLAACEAEEAPQAAAETDVTEEAPPGGVMAAAAIPPRADEARPSPNARVNQTIGTTEVTITYGRPGVKGRDVFGGLEPYGQVWRAGANEATVFHATGDVTINGEPLPAGVYGFFAIPGEDEWTLIFNREAEQWGAFDYDEEQDALRVKVTPEEGPHQEWLEYYFENLSDTSATAVLHWAETRVPFTVAVP